MIKYWTVREYDLSANLASSKDRPVSDAGTAAAKAIKYIVSGLNNAAVASAAQSAMSEIKKTIRREINTNSDKCYNSDEENPWGCLIVTVLSVTVHTGGQYSSMSYIDTYIDNFDTYWLTSVKKFFKRLKVSPDYYDIGQYGELRYNLTWAYLE